MLYSKLLTCLPQLWSWQPMMLCVALGCVNVSEFHHVALRNLQGLPVFWFRSLSGPSLTRQGPPTPPSLFQPEQLSFCTWVT